LAKEFNIVEYECEGFTETAKRNHVIFTFISLDFLLTVKLRMKYGQSKRINMSRNNNDL